MSIQNVWFNLPVKDIARSKAFFSAIGFTLNPRHEHATTLSSFLIGKQNICMMIFLEDTFVGFSRAPITDTKTSSEILLNIDAESREEVDQMAERVRKAGGTIFAEPGEAQGWMYAFGFSDPDGHRWSMLYMDMSKMPSGI